MRILFLFLAVSVASADDLDDRIRAAQAQLESDDSAVRDKGEADLVALASEAGARLKPLLDHPDAEVRARVSRALDRAGIIPEEGKTALLRELFEVLAKAGTPDEARLGTVRDILELHPRTAAFISRELAEGKLTWDSDRTRVVPPGRVAVEFEATNEGDCAAWVRPSRWYVLPRFKQFGERPGRMSLYSGAAGGLVGLLHRDRSAEDSMVLALASMVRVPPKGRQGVVSGAIVETRCGSMTFQAQAMGYSPRAFEATFSGTVLRLPEADPGTSISAVRILLQEKTGRVFRASSWEKDGSRGLDVTPLEDAPALKLDNFDPFWWVAMDEKGEFLDEGAFSTEAADLAAWKKNEARRVKMRGGPPAGTKTLWMGFSGGGDECVPAPVELK
ncbi:MAG: hypothetical protein AAB074_16810 [Planctomycetota bacterium]